MTFLPAPPNTGIRFRRVDLEGKPEIEARAENVVENNRSTTLAKGNTRVHTVEHVLATFAGYGIDNAIVELDANEPPIADGSAREYCKMVQNAGIVPQDERRDPYTVTAPIELEMGETMMTLFPDEGFKISCTSADKQGRFTQFYSVELSPTTWERDLAHARTFCFYEEIEFLINNGLIKGGSLENAVVIRDDAVLTTEPLRYPGRIRPAQDAGHRGGPVAAGPAAARAPDCGQARPCGQLRAGPADHGANAQAAGGRAGLRPAPGGAQSRADAGRRVR